MAIIVSDSMTDTNWDDLAGEHTPEVGGAWVQHPADNGGAGRFYIFQNRTHCGVAGAIYNEAEPDSADYTVSCDYTVLSHIGSVSIAGRMDTTNATYYYTYYASGTGTFVLVKSVAGTLTTLGFDVQSFPAGSTVRLALDMSGTTIRVLIDDVEIINETDASIAAKGRAGVRAGAANDAGTGKHIDNFIVEDGASDPVPPVQVLGFIGL